VLTLAAHDDDEAYGTFAAAVARRSHGAIRIKVAGTWLNTGDGRELDFERGLVEAVRAGKAQLGIVGVRVWDTLGVDAFQALVAPFLIDSLRLERRAIESPPASQALAELRRAGVVGIALLPGRLRRPLGITRPLLGPGDYRGARIGVRPGRVARATFSALGARPASYIPGLLLDFDGVENDPLTITENGYDGDARTYAANVAFWPKPQTLIMNRAAYERLSARQQQLLQAAGRDALAPELTRIARDQRLGLSTLCAAGTVKLVRASKADLAALRKVVQPVYEQLDRDPQTQRWIALILGQKTAPGVAPDMARCP
jgi:TRAP-type C4-dicarboxylate transport system substrate-binding protein